MSLIWTGKNPNEKPCRGKDGQFMRKLDLEMLRRPLVPGGIKCSACGSTILRSDPLPHQCGDFGMHAIDTGRCAL
jgi:hypothetical protein